MSRFDREKLHIGTYILRKYAQTEQHIKELAECGIDTVICMDNDPAALDLFEKYGVMAIVSGDMPGWWGGDGERAGKLCEINTEEMYADAIKNFVDHPAICGIDVGDEPSALDFPYYGKVTDKVRRAFPEKFPYLNLYPNYASIAKNDENQTMNQLGTATYDQHIEEYCKNVGLDYICFDFYVYTTDIYKFYENLRVVADACRKSGRSMWTVLQVNSHRPEKWITLNQLKYQAYTSLAFGTEFISWACYSAGWFSNQVLDEKGQKTQQYDKLKVMNAELISMGREYMKYRNVSTHFLNFCNDEAFMAKVAQKSVSRLDTGVFFDVCEENGYQLAVGQMIGKKREDGYALMVAAVNDPQDQANKRLRLTFRAPGREVAYHDGKTYRVITPDANGVYSIVLDSCEGVLITAK